MNEPRSQTARRLRPRHVIMAIVLGLIGVIVYAVFWAMTVRPNPKVDYAREMVSLSAASQPPGENGWPLLVKTAALANQAIDGSIGNQVSDASQAIDFGALLDGEGAPEAISAAREALDRLRASGAFDQWAAAAKCPNAVRPVQAPEDGPLLMMLLPEIAQFRHLAKARAATMRLAFDANDHDEALAAFDQIMFLAGACTHQTTLIDHLVGYSISALALTELRANLVQYPVDAETLRGFQRCLDQRTPLGPISLALEGERRSILDVIQRVYSDNGRGDGFFLPSQMEALGLNQIVGSPAEGMKSASRLWNLTGVVMAGRKETTAAANELYDNLVRQSRLSRASRLQDSFSDDAFIQNLGWRHSLLQVLLPAVGRAVTVQDAATCQIAGTKLMLAIEIHRARSRSYPAGLNDLIPGTLERIPEDPFGPLGFQYLPLSNDPAGRQYLLFSAGADGQVDGGKAAPKPSEALSAGRGAGFDFVFNLPRPITTAPAPDSESR